MKTGRDERGRTPLAVAAMHGDLPEVKRLLAAGAKTEELDLTGSTALFLAVKAKTAALEIVDELLRHGADPNVQDDTNRSTLMFAVMNGSIPIMKRLLKAGADPGLESDYHETAGWLAEGCGSLNEKMTSILLSETPSPSHHGDMP